MAHNSYRIGELAEKAGVTRRTVHYYMGRGLLPPPEGAGLGTTYSDEHLYRIMLIKKLQRKFLPLDEIKKRIVGMTINEVKRNLDNLNNDELSLVQIEALGNVKNDASATAENKASPGIINEAPSMYMPGPAFGTRYERINIGYGVEIHFPAESEKARELAWTLYKYAENIMKEG